MLFYFISPIPLAIARKCGTGDYLSQESSSLLYEVCYFLSACIVVSGFGLPFVLARRQIVSNVLFCIEAKLIIIIIWNYYIDQIQAASGALIGGANLFVFGTVYSFFVFFGRDDEWDWNSFWLLTSDLSTSSSHKYHNIINVMFLSQFFMHNVWLLRVMITVIIVALTV